LVVWDKSSRGPTVQGETKPDFVVWGTNLEMASEQSDDGFITKSGTSFAAPMLAGLTGLLWESGRRAYGESWIFRWTEARQYAPYFSTKPADAPIKKDNAYGYGLPAMGSMIGGMTQVTAPTNDMASIMPVFMMMSMMAGITGGI
jgi:serine protease AprX